MGKTLSKVNISETQSVVKEISLSYQVFKRICDIFFSFIGLMVVLPIILLFSVMIMIETPGSPLFFQERLGIHGRMFTIIKLRSMRLDAEKNGAQWASRNDSRVTRIGRIMRNSRIDELPQLFNVLKGDMSIVGPRPERPVFSDEFEKYIPGFMNRLAVKPGLTGWAQINGGYDITPEEKLRFDIYYINHVNVWFDAKIILKTVKVLVMGDGAR